MKTLYALAALIAITISTNSSANEEKSSSHRVPSTYIGSTNRLKSISHELKELTEKHQLYKFHEPLELFDAILVQLPQKAEDGIYQEMRSTINEISSDLGNIAMMIDQSADNGDKETFNLYTSTLHKSIKRLEVYSDLSNEIKTDFGHNIPQTYRKMLSRLKGVQHALHDMGEKGYIYKAHEEAEHINNISKNISQAFETNVINTLKLKLSENKQTLLQFSEALHKAADEEDDSIAMAAFEGHINEAIKNLKSLGSKLSSKSKNHHH